MRYVAVTITTFAISMLTINMVTASASDLNSCDDVATMGAVFYDMANEDEMTEESYLDVIEYNVDNGLEMGARPDRVQLFREIADHIWTERGVDRGGVLQEMFDACESNVGKLII
jgi:hypothetical protein